jgi:hypothetical protein
MQNSRLVNLNLPERAVRAMNADASARTSPVRSAIVQALFAHAVEGVHADLADASERGALPPRVSVRSLSPLPGTTSFVVDVRPDLSPRGARFRPIAIDRVLVRMTDQAVGNRPVDGVNARERLRPTTVEMLAEAYSPVLHRPTPRYPAPRMCGSADEAVDLLTRLLL